MTWHWPFLIFNMLLLDLCMIDIEIAENDNRGCNRFLNPTCGIGDLRQGPQEVGGSGRSGLEAGVLEEGRG